MRFLLRQAAHATLLVIKFTEWTHSKFYLMATLASEKLVSQACSLLQIIERWPSLRSVKIRGCVRVVISATTTQVFCCRHLKAATDILSSVLEQESSPNCYPIILKHQWGCWCSFFYLLSVFHFGESTGNRMSILHVEILLRLR